MKIFQVIGTPGTALPRAAHADLSARWGAGLAGPVEFSTYGLRRFRSCTGFPVTSGTQAQVTSPIRRNAMSGSFVLDGPVVKPAGVPLPIGKRSP